MKAELIDVYGSDERVVDAARVSFDKVAANYTTEQNAKLIKYLADHEHWSPFAHVSVVMRETVPIFVARQRFKHRIGFEYNEVSRRYVSDEPSFFVPDAWRRGAENKKQGSSDEVINLKHWGLSYNNQPKYITFHKEKWEAAFPDDPWGEITEDTEVDGSIHDGLNELYDVVLRVYNNMIAAGVAPEQARMVLPQSMYTSYYTTGSLAAWARAYKLRSDEHSQKEIQDLAKQWDEIISGIPELKYSWTALKE